MSKDDERDRLQIPRWMMIGIFGVVISLSATGVSTWAKANDNAKINDLQDTRIQKLEDSLSAISANTAKTTQEVRDLKSAQDSNSGKLDRILELEMARK